MTLTDILLFAFMLAGTLGLVLAHRNNGWPLDLWLDVCNRSRRDHLQGDDRGRREPSRSTRMQHDS